MIHVSSQCCTGNASQDVACSCHACSCQCEQRIPSIIWKRVYLTKSLCEVFNVPKPCLPPLNVQKDASERSIFKTTHTDDFHSQSTRFHQVASLELQQSQVLSPQQPRAETKMVLTCALHRRLLNRMHNHVIL